jgi:hypothetical protein
VAAMVKAGPKWLGHGLPEVLRRDRRLVFEELSRHGYLASAHELNVKELAHQSPPKGYQIAIDTSEVTTDGQIKRIVLLFLVVFALTSRELLGPGLAHADGSITVQGVAWYDDDLNRRLEPAETVASNAEINIQSGERFPTLLATATTDSSGSFTTTFEIPKSAAAINLIARVLRPGYPYQPCPRLPPTQICHEGNYAGLVSLPAPLAQPSPLTVRIPLIPGHGVLNRLAPGSPPDFPVANGHFFTQTNGFIGNSSVGFAVTNADGIPFWDTWQQYGLDEIGYPLTDRYVWAGYITQIFQKAVFQWRPDLGAVGFINVYDVLHNYNDDDFLFAERLTPHQLDPSFDDGKPWEEIVQSRLELLNANPAIKARYDAVADPLQLYGLPTSQVEDMGNAYVLRAQRAVFQQWKTDVPWAKAGDVTIANGGEIGRQLGIFTACIEQNNGCVDPSEPQPP